MTIFRQLFQAQITSTSAASIYNFSVASGLDVDTIDFIAKNNAGSVIRLTFNSTPNLSLIVPGMKAVVTSATNSSNNGEFFVTQVNDASDWIEIFNPNRANNADDEASDSPAVVSIKPVGSVVIKQINIVENSGSGSGYSLYHDDDGSTYDNTTIIKKNLSHTADTTDELKDLDISSNSQSMNLAAKIETSGDDVTITGYGFIIN